MKIIGTGLSGLVGSRIIELLPQHSFEDISRKTGTDILDEEALLQRVKNSESEYILHFAAYTNVDKAEEQKSQEKESDAWKINVVGTENIVKVAQATHKKLIAISTDFVFNGEHTPEKGYTEKDLPHPINWYGKTKYEAELHIQQATIPWTILRIAYPYRADFEKNDFFRAIKTRLSHNQSLTMVTDHIFCPTFIDDIAYALDALIGQNATGIFHTTGGQVLSPYDVAIEIADTFGYNKERISQTTRLEYFKNQAPRPFNLSMNNGKIESLGVRMRGFKEGLIEVKKQISNS